MDDHNRVIEGYLDCSEHLIVAVDRLGRDYATTIAGESVTVSMPRLGSSSAQLNAPKWAYETDTRAGKWGIVTYWRGDDPQVASGTGVRFAFTSVDSEMDARTTASRVTRSLIEW